MTTTNAPPMEIVQVEYWCYRTEGGDLCFPVGDAAIPAAEAHQRENYPNAPVPIRVEWRDVSVPVTPTTVDSCRLVPCEGPLPAPAPTSPAATTPATTILPSVVAETPTTATTATTVETPATTVTSASFAAGAVAAERLSGAAIETVAEVRVAPHQVQELPTTGAEAVAVMLGIGTALVLVGRRLVSWSRS